MMLLIWPMIFALILGLIIGSQIKLKNGDTHFTLGSFIVILIAGTFLSALIGIFVGKLIFARSK